MQKDKTQSRLKDLENLVLSQQDRLFALAYIRIGNRADAEDILQDVFLKLFRSEENLRHVNRLEHYLIHTVCNILAVRRILGHIGEGSEGFAPSLIADSPAYFKR